MPNKMIEVPLKIGWFNYDESDMSVDWFDNTENLTLTQCKFVCDFVSKETKFVESTKSDDEFNREQEALRQNIFSL